MKTFYGGNFWNLNKIRVMKFLYSLYSKILTKAIWKRENPRAKIRKINNFDENYYNEKSKRLLCPQSHVIIENFPPIYVVYGMSVEKLTKSTFNGLLLSWKIEV